MTIGVFGSEVSTKWGSSYGYPYTMVWGTSKWGYGTNTIIFDFQKLLSNNLLSDSTISKQPQKLISNSMVVSGDMNSEKLSQGGWDYVFPPNTIEAENRVNPTWSSSSAQSQTYTCQAAGSTTWT